MSRLDDMVAAGEMVMLEPHQARLVAELLNVLDTVPQASFVLPLAAQRAGVSPLKARLISDEIVRACDG